MIIYDTMLFQVQPNNMKYNVIIPIIMIAHFIPTLYQARISFSQEYIHEAILNDHHDIERELDILKNEPFIAVSLGENCFFADHMKEHGIRIRSFPFDWDIDSFSALYNIIKNDFNGLLDLRI